MDWDSQYPEDDECIHIEHDFSEQNLKIVSSFFQEKIAGTLVVRGLNAICRISYNPPLSIKKFPFDCILQSKRLKHEL